MVSQRRILFQVWLVKYADWRPLRWSDVPPRASAVEPLETRLLSAKAAAQFVEGFNSELLTRPEGIWAVPVPMRVRLECAPQPGMPLPAGLFGPPTWPHRGDEVVG